MLVTVRPFSYVGDNVSICGCEVPVWSATAVLGGVSSLVGGVLSGVPEVIKHRVFSSIRVQSM